jgi:hypothetical protein
LIALRCVACAARNATRLAQLNLLHLGRHESDAMRDHRDATGSTAGARSMLIAKAGQIEIIS